MYNLKRVREASIEKRIDGERSIFEQRRAHLITRAKQEQDIPFHRNDLSRRNEAEKSAGNEVVLRNVSAHESMSPSPLNDCRSKKFIEECCVRVKISFSGGEEEE